MTQSSQNGTVSFLRNIPPNRKRGKIIGLAMLRAIGKELVRQEIKYPKEITDCVSNSRIPIVTKNLSKLGSSPIRK